MRIDIQKLADAGFTVRQTTEVIDIYWENGDTRLADGMRKSLRDLGLTDMQIDMQVDETIDRVIWDVLKNLA